jgi:hypothetical protein
MEKPGKKELLDCPFCGNKALTKIEQPRMDSDNVPKYCKCSYGPCCASRIYWPIEQWNTRAMSTWLEGEVPSAKEIYDDLYSSTSLPGYFISDERAKSVILLISQRIHKNLTRKLKGEV